MGHRAARRRRQGRAQGVPPNFLNLPENGLPSASMALPIRKEHHSLMVYPGPDCGEPVKVTMAEGGIIESLSQRVSNYNARMASYKIYRMHEPVHGECSG